MSVFGNVEVDHQAEDQQEFNLPTSGIYLGKIARAWFSESAKGAKALNLDIELDNGQTFRETKYWTNRNGQTFYTGKNGKNYNLPGYAILNNLAMIAAKGKKFTELTISELQYEVYDSTEKKEVKKMVSVPVELLNVPVLMGVQQIRENKTEHNQATDKYDPINEDRFFCELNEVFSPKNQMTAPEILAKATEPKRYDNWLKRHSEPYVDKYEEVAGVKSGSPSGANRGSDVNFTKPAGNEPNTAPAEDNPFG